MLTRSATRLMLLSCCRFCVAAEQLMLQSVIAITGSRMVLEQG